MLKKLIRIGISTFVSATVLVKFVQIGFHFNILNTAAQWNICMVLGILIIAVLNLQILLEKQEKVNLQ